VSYQSIKQSYLSHYNRTFQEYGERPEGVNWGPDPADLRLRLDRVIACLEAGNPEKMPLRILEVGCGYGSLLDRLNERGFSVEFTGLDLCESLVAAARSRHPGQRWVAADIFDFGDGERFDFVLCNGLVNLRMEASLQDIGDMARRLLTKMFALSTSGCSLNFMTTAVNFFAPHLFYQSPVEIIAWSMSALTKKFRLDHAYSLYEFTLHLYHEDAPGLSFGSHRSANPATGADRQPCPGNPDPEVP